MFWRESVRSSPIYHHQHDPSPTKRGVGDHRLYLPSQALAAVGLSPPSSWDDGSTGQLSPASRAIIASMAAKRGLDFVNVETASQLATLTDEHLRIILDCMTGVKSSLGLLSVVIRAVELRSNANDNVPGGYDELPSEANLASALCLKNGALSLGLWKHGKVLSEQICRNAD